MFSPTLRQAIYLVLITVNLWTFAPAGLTSSIVNSTEDPVGRILPLAASTGPAVSAPARLLIPEIGVDAAVEKVGLTAGGAMASPSQVSNVGWLRTGPRPGDNGSAVMAGHLNGNTWGRTGVFGKLHLLKVGDLVFVEDSQGLTTTFTVWKIRTYGADEEAPDVFAPAGGTYLNLVTCDGVWDQGKQNYSQRLVVFTAAEKVLVN